ncbi:MAG TPA: hypothetical protein VEL05_11875 [Candidatus Acidoferrum sp.]|nr:hypothetical protein [Candidatus Acidoferrum sp.]
MGELASTIDPAGRRVVLTDQAWRRITADHPGLADYLDDVMRAVTRPGFVTPDPGAGGHCFWRQSIGPSGWLAVVVDLEHDPAIVVAATPQRTDPPGWPSGLSAGGSA